ncbi:MAG: hypothetical protein GOU98_02670 [Candidatus Altiarchaeota archaeon]|nr:hypothetical protein [Candidatus Altiarchaeota archaeon]
MSVVYSDEIKPFDEILLDFNSKPNDYVYSIPFNEPLELRSEAKIVARRAYELALKRVRHILIDLDFEGWDELTTPDSFIYVPYDIRSKGKYVDSRMKTGMQVFGELIEDFAYDLAKTAYFSETNQDLDEHATKFIAKVARESKNTTPERFYTWIEDRGFPERLLVSYQIASEENDNLLDTASYAVGNYLEL